VGRLSATLPGPLWERPNVCPRLFHADDLGSPPAASTRRSQAASYVTGGKDLPDPTVTLEKPACAVLAVIHIVRRSELAKAMAGCDFNLTQAAARESLAVLDALSVENLFDAARAPEKPARTVLPSYSGKPAKRAAGDIDCHLESAQSKTACRKGAGVFISSARSKRGLPVSVPDRPTPGVQYWQTVRISRESYQRHCTSLAIVM
jgi:hypothetical protein